MSGTNAERQRRYRAHRKGDHSLCHPERCNASTDTPSRVTQRRAVRLGPRGQRLWDDLAGAEPEPAARVLIEEACRIADRLDKLDALLGGDADDWLGIVEAKGNPERQELVINAPLAEARQQATALKQLLAELRQMRTPAKASGASLAQRQSGGGGVADLTARLAQRRTAG